MASIFFQTIMFLLFCSTCGVTFLAAWTQFESVYKAICVASVLWSTFLFALVEGLSLFKAITAQNLLIAWGIFLILVGLCCMTKKNLLREKIKILTQKVTPPPEIKYLLGFIAFFMIARTVLALITAPNGGNLYHLERAIYWIQHKNVDYYDTSDMRQVFSPVLAEYIYLNLLLITGGDFFANMVQNFSAYGCVILLYGIIRKLGCGIKWALFGCVLVLSMNIFCVEAILASGVDMVCAFYLTVLTYLIIEVLYQPKLSAFQFILLGLISGFIYITKTSSCAPAAVIIIYVVIAKIFEKNFKIIPLGLVSLIFIGLIVFPTFYRNYQAFDGDFMADVNVGRILIGTLSPVYVLVNVIKNLADIGVERNAILLRGFVKAIGKLLNIDINAPEISFNSCLFQLEYFLDMNTSGAHLVTPLFLIATIISLFSLIKRRTKTEGLMFALILQLYSILIILRWQFEGGRLILPALVVAVIPIVYYFREIAKILSRDKNSWKYKACNFLIIYFIFEGGMCSLESLGFHSYVALGSWRYPRYGRYFGIGQNLKTFDAYMKFSSLIDDGNYENIGLCGRGYQYPILAKYVPQSKRVECVSLSDSDEALNPTFEPDIIIVDGVELDPEKIYNCNGNDYECIYHMSEAETDYTHLGAFYNYSAWVKK